MEQEIIKEAPSVEEALDAALEELGVQQDAVDYVVLQEPSASHFGIGGKPAKVSVKVKASYLAEMARSEDDEGVEEEQPPAAMQGSFAAVSPDEISEEELDGIADQAVSAIQNILKGFGISVEVEEYEGDDGELILDINGEDLGVLIGRHGRTLDALQTLVAAITHRQSGVRYPVLVDVEGYRFRRKAKLEEIAKSAADRASRQKRPVKLRPMSSYERKVVHVVLRDDRRVVTASEGEEPFRQVVVSPK